MPDYEFYRNVYRKGKLTEEDFQQLAAKAWAYLEALTMGRVNMTLPPPAEKKVKLACCAVVDEYAIQERGGEVASADNDGYRETYVHSGRTANQKLYDAAVLHLATTGLLYAGIGGC